MTHEHASRFLRRPVRTCLLMFIAIFLLSSLAFFLLILLDDPRHLLELHGFVLWSLAYSAALSIPTVGAMLCHKHGHAREVAFITGGCSLTVVSVKIGWFVFFAKVPADENFFNKLGLVVTLSSWALAAVGVTFAGVACFGWYLHLRETGRDEIIEPRKHAV
jgi:hypothetical protein